MLTLKSYQVLLLPILAQLVHSNCCQAFDEEDLHTDAPVSQHPATPLPKDKVLLKGLQKLVFYRNKMTTSRRTHSIHQLSCVGGSAGCKMFAPNVVECDNMGWDMEKRKIDWKCRADIDERATFNHVEIVCEGYDYAEDDYILLGSCGLEFTLDYKDPDDHHDRSYFHHMDEEEKDLHRRRKQKQQQQQAGLPQQTLGARQTNAITFMLEQVIMSSYEHPYLVGSLASLLLLLAFILIIKSRRRSGSSLRAGPRFNYGPLASAAILTTKKAC